MRPFLHIVSILLLLGAISCGSSNQVTDFPVVKRAMVYSMSNESSGNALLRFVSKGDGSLESAGTFSTGGTGTGAGLENQGALSITQDGKFLLVVNPASDDFSIFSLEGSEPRLLSTLSSGGKRPISVSTQNGLIYVLNSGGNAGDTDNAVGFRLRQDGTVTQILGANVALSAAVTNPAQVELSPDGSILVITERGTSLVHVVVLTASGMPAASFLYPSAGQGPFGFSFAGQNRLLISEAGTNSASSYSLSNDGNVQVISPAVGSGQRAVCWLGTTPDGKFTYTANTGSRTLTGYLVSSDGSLQLFDSNGVSATVTAAPFDLSISRDGQFLYVLTGRQNIESFKISPQTGVLTPLQSLPGLPAGSNGLVAF